MVSIRCKRMVKQELMKLGLEFSVVKLGTGEMLQPVSLTQKDQLKKNLLRFGLELLDDKKSILIEKIKHAVTEVIYHAEELPRVNDSDYPAEKLNYDYTYLANIFSKEHAISIQQFIIINKIERVKELLLYNELNLTQIATELNYSSVAHLSNQFKKNTGISPSSYKMLKQKSKYNFENV